MIDTVPDASPDMTNTQGFLAGGGALGGLMRAHDWSASPLGPPEGWPQSLRSVIQLMLNNRQLMFVAWGPELTFLYNDGYAPTFGARHPWALGRPFREVWSEIWDDLEPLVRKALGGETTWSENLHLVVERNGYPEDAWFTFSYSPLRDESGRIAGMFCAGIETTGQVLAERRLTQERERQRKLFEQAPGFITILSGPELRFEFANEAYERLFGDRDYLGSTVREVFPDLEGQPFFDLLDDAYATGERFVARAIPIQIRPTPEAEPAERFLDFIYEPVRDDGGAVTGLFIEGYDVTDAHLAREALRDSEARSRGVLDGMGEGLVLLDRDFRVVEINDEGLRLDRRPRGEIVGRTHWEAWPGTEESAQGRLYKRAMAERRSVAVDVHHVWEDGREGWLEVRAYPAADGLSIFYRDVTERVRADQALRETSRRLNAVLDNTREAVFLMDERQHCAYANAAAETLTGYSLAEMQGRPLHDVVHHKKPDGSHYPLEECPIDRAYPERAQMSGEELFVHKDGSFYPVAFTASPVLDDGGRPIGTVIEARNIADDKAREAALRLQGEEFQALADNIPLLCWMAHADGHIYWYNRRWYEYTGTRPEDQEGWGWEAVHDPELLPEIAAEWRRSLASGEPFDITFPLRGGDGSYRIFLTRAVPIRDGAGAIARWFGTNVDITDQRDAAERLRELNETLEERVAEEIAERAKAEDALRQAQKMEAVGQLTGGIAHDFNNLLTIVVGNTDMARRALAAGEIPRANRAVDQAQKGAERAAALTQRLLAFSRRQPLAPKPLDVDRLVAGMADLLHRALGETVKLETVSNPGLWRVEVDPNQLESAILNLAVNARDAMPDGGKLTVETANARLDEGYSAAHTEVAPGQYVVVAVTDTGGGMSKETLARVFEPFFTTKEVGKGTGLGLSMVYGFTKQSGGHVKIYSEEGEGTTVKIYLPRLLGPQDEQPEASGARAPEATRREETVLVVEDDDDVRAYTVEILRELGYRVLEAHDGPAALRLIERQDGEIRLMFTDVVMPGMSGRELADKARILRPDLKVLYTSGYTRNAIVHGGRLDAGVEMIAKPFTYAALAEKVRDVLEAGRTGRLLVVEDEPDTRLLAVELLEEAGYAVDQAATGSEALNRVRSAQGRYDAVILDVRLPEKRGDALAVELRAMHADLPILLASGEHEADLRERFAGDRCVGVIGKPYDGARLRAALTALGVSCRS